MKFLFLSLYLFISMGTSFIAHASTCLTSGSSVDSRNGFCVTFNLNSDGSNRVRLENSHYFPMWTDDDDFDGYYQQIFDDDYVGDGIERQFQVKFERTSNFNARWIIGKLTYSVNGIQKQVINNFDLSYATGADKFNPFITIRVIGSAFTDSSKYCISNNGCNTLEPPSKPLFEFGQVNASDCSGYTCSFDFNTDFKTTPIVVLMSSYDINDHSSAMFVTSVTRDRAVLKQRFPLSSDPHRMEPIYYFAAEVGDIVLDDSQPGKIVYVRKVELSNFQTAGNTRGESWKLETYSERFSTTPVVFSQVQPDSGKDFWVTTAHKSVGKSSFKIALEFGRQSVPNSTSNRRRTVGYLVSPQFSGQTSEGVKFTFQRPAYSYDQDVSLAQSCVDNQVPHGQLFDSFGVIAQKQTRTGPDGGWLRVCNISSNDYFTFVLEEDASNRLHQAYENIGFFAFEQQLPRPPIDKCDYFPEMLQSNRYRPSSNLGEWIPWDGTLNISSGNGSGNNIYLNQLSKSEAIGFSYSNVSGVGACVYKDGQNSGGSCTVSVAKNLFPSGTPDTSTFSAYGNSLVAAGNNQSTLATKYNYTSLSFSPNTSTVILPAGEYWIDTINFDQNDSYIKLKGDGPVVIHYNHINFFQKSRIYINAGKNDQGDPDSNYDHNNLTFVGHGALSAFWPQSGSDIRLNANVYVSPESASAGFDVNNVARFQMTGSITAPRVTFRARDNSYIKAQGVAGCYTPPEPTIKYIKVEPNNYHLTCGDTGQVYVTPYDDNNQPMDNVDGETVSISAQGVTFSGGSFDSQNKRFVFDIDSRDGNQYGAIPVTANVVGTAIEDTSDLIFVPLKFEINNEEYIELVAGQRKGSIPIKALACDIMGKPISLGYSVDLDESNLTQTQFIPSSGNSASLELDASVTNGEGSVSLKFDESGMFEGDLKALILCTDFPNAQDCPENTVKEVVGKVKFKARPWKIAICDVKEASVPSNLNPATTTGNPGFMASGENFSVKYRPIIFGSGDECNLDVTTNYALDSGPLNVSFKLVYPNIVDDNLNITPAAVGPFDNSSELVVSNYVWDEVGSVQFKTSASYRAMDLNEDTEIIGRFYPKYFLQENPEWNVANQNDIAYLGQPYDSSVHQVYPMASGESSVGNALNNYRFFRSDLQAKFGVLDDTATDNEFLLDTGAGTWSTDRKHWLLNDSAAVLKRVTDSDGVSRKDNPFNTSDANSTVTHFGLTVAGVDPVSFTDSDSDSDPVTDSAAFPVQPPARYGRMALDDIGGNSGSTLTIPLRAEFWNGDEFVPSQIDSRSTFDGSKACKQVIWHSEGAITTLASLNGSGSVNDGEEDVSANQNTPAGTDTPREQVRLWLRMSNSKPSKKTGENDISCSTDYEDQPWLQYNWRQLGDEDPSTVATFGIYRGNDRVIYRGESGLTGQ